MKKSVIVAFSAIIGALAMSADADTHCWVGGSHDGGGWNTAANWTNSNGEAEAPVKGDIALFDDPAVTVTANDDDLPLACSLSLISIEAYSSKDRLCGGVIFESDNDYTVDAAIRGDGFFRKRGNGRLTFNSVNITDLSVIFGSYGVYDMKHGGVNVDAGTLVLPQDKTVKYHWHYSPVNVAAGATLVLVNNNDSHFGTLEGGGIVINEADRMVTLRVGRDLDQSINQMSVFAGKIGPRIKLFNTGYQAFTGEDNEFEEVYCDYGSAFTYNYGRLCAKKMGMSGSPSSLGPANTYHFMYGGNFLYLGTGETTDHNIGLDTRPNGREISPVVLDAGAHGGLRIEGNVAWSGWGSAINECWQLSRLYLTGSNTVPCTVAGPIKLDFSHGSTNFTFSLVKQGTGVWAIEENPGTEFGGPVFVREGSLRFDSLREKGELCALGRADRLVNGSIGQWNDEYVSDVAFRLGCENPATNAVLEFNGATPAKSLTRPLLLEGDGSLRASGSTIDATLCFGGVSAAAGGEKTLVLDGGNAGANRLMNAADGKGRLSLVKDGSGLWELDGEQSFSGALRVKQGTLKVVGDKVFRYFRVTFWDNGIFNSPYNGYVSEFALYSADGERQNLDLHYNLPAGAQWDNEYPLVAGSEADLAPGEIAFGYIPDFSYHKAYPYTNGNELTNICNGIAGKSSQFLQPFPLHKQTVAMRLKDDSKEVCYLDFCQSHGHYENKGYQTFSAVKVEGSYDGRKWVEVYMVDDLGLSKSPDHWYFSKSERTVATNPGSRPVGDGEAAPLKTRACYPAAEGLLANVGSLQIDPGAVFEAENGAGVVIRKLIIDASTGSGAIRGVSLAEDAVVDIVNLPREGALVPVDFSGIANISEVRPSFTVSGKSASRYHFRLTARELRILPKGFTVKVR